MSQQVEVIQAESFWSKVDRRGPNDCWPWLAGQASTGYGRFWVAGWGRPAHQVAWELHNQQPFPVGKLGCHSCDNPICVNPDHIWPGTQAENLRDCVQKGRHTSKPATHCKRGHPLTPENRLSARSEKRCRVCTREKTRLAMRRLRAKRRAARG